MKLIEKRRFRAVICKKNTNINKTEYPLGLYQKNWPAAHLIR